MIGSIEQHNERFFNRLAPGQLLEPLFDSIPGVHYFVKDCASRFVSASESFARILGAASVRDLVGKTDFDYSADFLAEGFVADDRMVIKTGKKIDCKIELVPTEDSLDWLSTTKIPLYDCEGNVIGLAGITRMVKDSEDLYHDHPEMRRIIAFIQSEFRGKITIEDMANAAGISASSVDRLFRSTFGVTPWMYLRKTRLNAACRLLHKQKTSITAIAENCGFNDQASMTRAFRQELKITPLKYRRRFSETRAGTQRNKTLQPTSNHRGE